MLDSTPLRSSSPDREPIRNSPDGISVSPMPIELTNDCSSWPLAAVSERDRPSPLSRRQGVPPSPPAEAICLPAQPWSQLDATATAQSPTTTAPPRSLLRKARLRSKRPPMTVASHNKGPRKNYHPAKISLDWLS